MSQSKVGRDFESLPCIPEDACHRGNVATFDSSSTTEALSYSASDSASLEALRLHWDMVNILPHNLGDMWLGYTRWS